ncbi:MAG: hypothetical protein ACJAZO_002221 [Myxococcota bacterium]
MTGSGKSGDFGRGLLGVISLNVATAGALGEALDFVESLRGCPAGGVQDNDMHANAAVARFIDQGIDVIGVGFVAAIGKDDDLSCAPL